MLVASLVSKQSALLYRSFRDIETYCCCLKMPHATSVEEGEELIPPRHSDSVTLSQSIVNAINAPTIQQSNVCEQTGPRDVPAQLHYLSAAVECSKSKPPIQVVTRQIGHRDPRTTVKISQGPVEVIHDVRGREAEFTLAKNGFQFVKNECKFQDWESRDGIWMGYIEELKELVAKEFGEEDGGVDEIIAFHEGVRVHNPFKVSRFSSYVAIIDQ